MLATEALAGGRPVLFAAPVPGHGRAGAEMTAAAGLALVCPRPADVTRAVRRLAALPRSWPRWPGERPRSARRTSTRRWWRWPTGSRRSRRAASLAEASRQASPRNPSPAGHGPQRLAQRAHRGDDRGRLVAAVGHAVGAARVVAAAVAVPLGGVEQLLVGRRVAVVQQVARPLPAEQRVATGCPTRCSRSRPCPRGSRGTAGSGSAASACGGRRRTPCGTARGSARRRGSAPGRAPSRRRSRARSHVVDARARR